METRMETTETITWENFHGWHSVRVRGRRGRLAEAVEELAAGTEIFIPSAAGVRRIRRDACGLRSCCCGAWSPLRYYYEDIPGRRMEAETVWFIVL